MTAWGDYLRTLDHQPTAQIVMMAKAPPARSAHDEENAKRIVDEIVANALKRGANGAPDDAEFREEYRKLGPSYQRMCSEEDYVASRRCTVFHGGEVYMLGK